MSLECVRAFPAEKAADITVIEREGSSAVRINPLLMAGLIGAEWVDVCQGNAEDMT